MNFRPLVGLALWAMPVAAAVRRWATAVADAFPRPDGRGYEDAQFH